eukprot:g21833.t1
MIALANRCKLTKARRSRIGHQEMAAKSKAAQNVLVLVPDATVGFKGSKMARARSRPGQQRSVAVRAFPSRDAIALCYRRRGELVFARSQNFAGWLRLAGEEGWMLAFAPEHGLLLQPRLAQETAELDLWALCDLWNTFRRKKRMLSPADVKSLKDWHQTAMMAHSLLRMAKEEPPFCELCLEMRLTPRPLPLELSTKATLEEVQGQPEPKEEQHSRFSRSSTESDDGDDGSSAPVSEEPKAPKAGYNGQSRGETDGARSSSTARGGSAPHRGAPHRPPAGPTGPMGFGGRPGGGRSGGRGPGGRAKGFGKGKGGFGGFGQMGQMGGFGLGPGLDGGMPGMGVMPVEVNGEELLMTEGGLLVDPETQAPVGVLNPMTGEVQEITEEHVQKLMETIGQINMVELNGRSAVSHTRVESVAGTGHEGPFDSTRPYLMMAGLLVDPQTQEVAFKVEPDGTVVDAQTGETMGMRIPELEVKQDFTGKVEVRRRHPLPPKPKLESEAGSVEAEAAEAEEELQVASTAAADAPMESGIKEEMERKRLSELVEKGKLSSELGPFSLQTLEVNEENLHYSSVNGDWALRRAVAKYYNESLGPLQRGHAVPRNRQRGIYRKGKSSLYTAENVAIVGGGRLALTRLCCAMDNVKLGQMAA